MWIPNAVSVAEFANTNARSPEKGLSELRPTTSQELVNTPCFVEKNTPLGMFLNFHSQKTHVFRATCDGFIAGMQVPPAIMRKLIILANALIRDNRLWQRSRP